MADITLCTGTGCLLRGSCWRYRAPPNEQQSRADFPGERNGAACSYYWPCGDNKPLVVPFLPAVEKT